MKKTLNITNHQGNANQNRNKISPHIFQNGIKNATRELWRKETLVCCRWDCKLVQPLWKIV